MLSHRNIISKARDIVIGNSEKYRIYLDEYVQKCRQTRHVHDYRPYLEDTMKGIYNESIFDALCTEWEQISLEVLTQRICHMQTILKEMEDQTHLNLHTPSYAAIIIADAVLGEDITEKEARDLSTLDNSVKAFYEMTRSKLEREYGSGSATR